MGRPSRATVQFDSTGSVGGGADGAAGTTGAAGGAAGTATGTAAGAGSDAGVGAGTATGIAAGAGVEADTRAGAGSAGRSSSIDCFTSRTRGRSGYGSRRRRLDQGDQLNRSHEFIVELPNKGLESEII